MHVTVCEMGNDSAEFAHHWQALVDHVAAHRSDLVILPEMPFHPWLAWRRPADPAAAAAAWEAAVAAHDAWLPRLSALAPAVVVGSRPVGRGRRRRNAGFVWTASDGARAVHHKYYLPDDPGFWEASWYGRGRRRFAPFRAGAALAGMLICTEMWFTEHARALARAGVQLLVVPRATEWASVDKWLAGGRVAGVLAGAFCLSSNRCGVDATGLHWGGHGWISDPDGVLLGVTSAESPCLTLPVDLAAADAAKTTYPRYVRE